MIALGEFDLDPFDKVNDPVLVQVFFFAATLFLLIVLLNLLISIISDTYAEIESHQVNSMYKEMAALIDDNDFLTGHNKVYNRYILIATPDQKEAESEDAMELKILEAVSQLKKEVAELRGEVAQLKE